MAAPLILMGLLGCAPQPCVDAACAEGEPDVSSDEDTAAMIYAAEDPEPVFSVEGFEQMLQRFLSLGGPSPMDIGYAFRTVMAEGDEDCPGSQDSLQQGLGCTAETGNYYSGIGWFIVMDSVTLDEGGDVAISWYHGGDFEIIRSSGDRFAGGGDLLYETEVEDDVYTTTFTVAGTWVDEIRDDWLGATFSGVYFGELVQFEDGFSLALDGGVGVEGLDFNFADLTWDTSSECAGAATGTIQIRDARGFWYSWELGDDCDTCGEVIFHGDQDLGELCLDLTEYGAMLAASSAPW